jgi:hypothetical protein
MIAAQRHWARTSGHQLGNAVLDLAACFRARSKNQISRVTQGSGEVALMLGPGVPMS